VTGVALDVNHLSKRFGGLFVVDDVSLRVPTGEARGIVGPNGAGKTTLLNLLSGILRADKGTISLLGREVTKLSVDRRARLGLARSFQLTSLFSSLSLRDNLTAATLGGAPRRLGLLPRSDESVAARVEAVADRFGLSSALDTVVEELPYGAQRSVEIAVGCIAEPDVLLLDEPSSGLGLGERREVADQLLSVAGTGVTLVMIEHDMDLVRRVCQTVTVLDRGRVIADGPVETVMEDDEVNRIYLGDD
jgi:ABC-type branched-subunit amino acid transport system ATPase component